MAVATRTHISEAQPAVDNMHWHHDIPLFETLCCEHVIVDLQVRFVNKNAIIVMVGHQFLTCVRDMQHMARDKRFPIKK